MTQTEQKQWTDGLAGIHIAFDVPMSTLTTLRVGGPAAIVAQPTCASQIATLLAFAHKHATPVTVIGNGSNLLVGDGGISGLVIRIADAMDQISTPVRLPSGKFRLTAQAGTPLIRLSRFAAENALTGLEFACGIPGTVGGAVCMNAGAYGGEMKQVLTQATFCSRTGELFTLPADQLALGYRTSVITQAPKGQEPILLSAVFELSLGDADAIKAAMRDFSRRRREKQPLTVPSCGSTFKRPEGHFAGGLIEQCGLKGYRVGGCSVSTLHAGFLVNDQNGTATDYLTLIRNVSDIVYEKTGVRLEPEVRILGEGVEAICGF